MGLVFRLNHAQSTLPIAHARDGGAVPLTAAARPRVQRWAWARCDFGGLDS